MTDNHATAAPAAPDDLSAAGSLPDPASPFPAPPPPQDAADDTAAAAATATAAPVADAVDELVDELEAAWVNLDPRGAGRDLTLTLRGIEEIDARLVTMQAQLALGVLGILAGATLLVILLKVKAKP
jgi:hypothetical protein